MRALCYTCLVCEPSVVWLPVCSSPALVTCLHSIMRLL